MQLGVQRLNTALIALLPASVWPMNGKSKLGVIGTGFDNKVDFNVWNALAEGSVHCKRMYLSKKEMF